ncbi:MAG: RecX family transcriptional regulator [Bacteroidales bacterium]|nr:RecX family transcriptional regulator [Bacteroidales bacterium]
MNSKITLDNAGKQLLDKAQRYCATSEQCCSSVQKKLLDWGAPLATAGTIVDMLVDEKYIDEARYSEAYIDSKVRHQRWGRIKIAYELRLKRIPNAVVTKAMATIDEEAYAASLQELTVAKIEALANLEPHQRRSKLNIYLSSRGFTPEEISNAINQNLQQ